MSTIFASPAELLGAVGKPLGTSEWLTITQERVNGFADATDDHQWIHVDPERAKAGPFGATIAHGYLTLSMLAGFLGGVVQVRDVRMGVNYGLNKVRFMAPVPVGSRLRARQTLLGAQPLEGGMQLAWRTTVEREGADKPVCVAEPLAQYFI